MVSHRFEAFFFLKVFGGYMSFFGATGTPVLDFWWRLFWVSKPEWVLPYSLFRSRSLPPHACAEVGLGSDSNGQSPRQKTNALPLWKRTHYNYQRLLYPTHLVICSFTLMYHKTSQLNSCRYKLNLVSMLVQNVQCYLQTPNSTCTSHVSPTH